MLLTAMPLWGIAVFLRDGRRAEGPENHSDSDDEERINMNNITIPWPDWTIVREIGRGGFGTVYEISRRDQFGYEERSALKIISIPYEAGEISQLRMDGYDNAAIAGLYEERLKEVFKEYNLQAQLKGNSNIVSVEERKSVSHPDGLGWDLFIRMELLHPMKEILVPGKQFTEQEIIRLGKDVCQALILCQKKNIIHRDIKPDNISLSDVGNWKLGDFGIARTMENTTTATKAGSFEYMAPEVYYGKKYGRGVDIYSLGMVLYWLLNNRRLPFLPTDRPPTLSEYEQARIKRFQGIPIPPPLDGSEGLKKIVLKACAYNPIYRYSSSEEMLKDLESLGERQSAISISEADGSHRAVSESEKNVENGWDDGGTIGDPKKFRGQEKEAVDTIEKGEKTERSVNVGDIVKKDEERIDTPGSKIRLEKPCPVRRLLVGEAILIGGIVMMLFGYAGLYLIQWRYRVPQESGYYYSCFVAYSDLIEFLVDIISRLLLMGGGPILTIVFWKADGKILSICRSLIYLNIFAVCFQNYQSWVNDNLLSFGSGLFLSILIAFYGGRWMLSEKMTGKKDKTK